jgi:hypothetical protein
MVMVMAKEMTVAMPKAVPVPVPVAVTVVTVTVVAVTMAAGESLARDRQGSRGKRESADDGRDDLLEVNHGESPWVCSAGIALPCCNPRGAGWAVM